MPPPTMRSAQAVVEEPSVENWMQACLSCGVITVDRSGNIISLNPEAKRVLRLPRLEPPADAQKSLPLPITTLIGQVFKTGKPASSRRITLNTLDDSATTLSVAAMPVSGELGFSVVAMLNDGLVEPRIEPHLRRLDRLARIGTLSAGLAHEIKNTLVPVKTLVDLLLEKSLDAELAETVRREIGRMETLVNHMLRFATQPQPVVTQMQLHSVLENSLLLLQPKLAAKMIALEKHFHAGEDPIPGDEGQLEQVFLNLLLNALDALSEQGTLILATDRLETSDGERVRVRVTDTGSGIAPEDLPNVFEPFFSTKPRGNGLGLAVTRRIIEEHKGSIEVESQPGRGTTFTIHLPAIVAPAST